MSLSGNLGFVPIEEVLRLLTRSRQQGAVEVTGSGLRGRVFVGKGGIDLATTWDDQELHRHLVNSGFTDENALRRITSAETTLAAIAESNQALIDLLREMTVESIYQIGHRGDDFEVHEGLTTPYASPRSFELESLLEDAAQRERDWSKVNEVLPGLAKAIKFRRDLGEREEVTVKVDDWKVLSEIGIGSSVSEIAEHLGTTEFWTARVTARLVKNDLIVIGDADVSQAARSFDDEEQWATTEPTAEEQAPADEHTGEEEHMPSEDTYAFEESPVEYQTDFDEPAEIAHDVEDQGEDRVDDQVEDDEDVNPNESWWQEPREETEAAEEVTGAETPEVVSEGLSEIPGVEGDDADVEEDTEAFLEKVFSELESSEESERETEEEGHGLLRRRRMGTLRDFSSDS